MMEIFFLLVTVIAISITNVSPLSQSVITYRFNEYIQRREVVDCGYECVCPDINSHELCLCEKQGVDQEKYPIEGPYAALLIQLDCFHKRNNPSIIWPPNKPMKISIYPDDGQYDEISGTEGVLSQLKIFPQSDINIRMKFHIRINNGVASGPFGPEYINTLSQGSKSIVYVLIPGWGSEFGKMFQTFARTLLERGNDDEYAVIVVDWLHGNQLYWNDGERIYETAAANTVYVG